MIFECLALVRALAGEDLEEDQAKIEETGTRVVAAVVTALVRNVGSSSLTLSSGARAYQSGTFER